MEFTLVKEKLTFLTFSTCSINTERKCAELFKRLDLSSVSGCTGDLKNGEYSGVNYFRKGLVDMLCNKNIPIWPVRRYSMRVPQSYCLMVILTMTSSKTATVKILQSYVNFAGVIAGVQIFNGLMYSALTPNNFGFNLKLTVADPSTGTPEVFEINGEDLKISMLEEEGGYGLEIKDVEISKEIRSEWKWSERDGDEGAGGTQDGDYENRKVRGEIALTLRLDHCAVKKMYLEGLGKKYYGDSESGLTVGGIDSDMVILADGEKDKEKGIKCHKKILSGCSPVFETMFQVDMLESKDNCVKIVDMTDAGVRAMLQFIYDGDLEVALENCEIALELLEAGHKYQMEHLEDAMMQIIWAKSVDWLSVDLVLKLLLFSRNGGGKFQGMEKTSLAILKWYDQKRPGSLMASEEYQRLLLEFPRIAMELGESVLKI